MMPNRALALILLAALLVPANLASAPGQGPEPPSSQVLDDALTWLLDDQDEEGCISGDPSSTAWTTVAAAGMGQNPASLGAPSLVDGLAACQPGTILEGAHLTDLERHLLAIVAAGQDPESFADRDWVSEIRQRYTAGQFLDPAPARATALNDDIFAILALRAAGVPASAGDLQGSAGFLLSHQNQDGGWGISASGGNSASMTDMTASALEALRAAERLSDQDEARQAALGFLETMAQADGTGCFQASQDHQAPNPDSTAWAILGLLAAHTDPRAPPWSVSEASPWDCLREHQDEDGGFGDLLTTPQAILALSAVPHGQARPDLAHPTAELDARAAPVVGEPVELTATGPAFAGWATPSGTVLEGTEVTWWPTTPGPATHQVLLVDQAGTAATLPVTFQVAPAEEPGTGEPDQPPTVEVTAPATGERNVTTTVHLEATPGSAPVTAFRIAWGDGNETTWAPTSQPTHTYHALGDHTLQAWAKDAEGRVSDPTTATLTIQDAAPRLELHGPTHVPRHTATLVTAEAWDPDGPTPTVTWQTPDGPATGPEFELRLQAPGAYELTATAQDALGQEATAHHRLWAVNQAPNVTAMTPQTAQANTTITLTAQTTDPDDEALDLTWSVDGQALDGESPRLAVGAPGNRTLQVNVTDPHGAWALAETVLQVLPEAAAGPETEPAPVDVERGRQVQEPATAPGTPGTPGAALAEPAVVHLPKNLTGHPGQATLVDGTAVQPGGQVRAIEVHLGGTVETRGTETFQALLPPLPTGTYELRARALGTGDAWGPWATATLEVTEPLETAELGADPGATGARSQDPATTPSSAPLLIAAVLAIAGLVRPRRPP